MHHHALERRTPDGPRGRRHAPKPFTALAHYWSKVLFPSTDGQDPDHLFADRYTQTIAFAMLLARIENVPLTDRNFADVARECRALQLLTETVDADFARRIDMLVQVIDAVDREVDPSRTPDAGGHVGQRVPWPERSEDAARPLFAAAVGVRESSSVDGTRTFCDSGR